MGDSAHPSSEPDRPPKRQKQMTVIACNSCKRRKSKVSSGSGSGPLSATACPALEPR